MASYVDAHSHVWTPDVASFPPLPGVFAGDAEHGWSVTSWTGEDLLAAAAPSGVGRAVLIGHGNIYGNDNTYMIDCCRRHPESFRIVAQIDDRGPDPAGLMRELLPQGCTGFRLTPGDRADWLSTPGMHAMWTAAAETRQAMCGLVNVPDLDEWEAMVAKYPETVVVIDHFCRIGIEGSVSDAEVSRLCALAKYPLVNVKLSAFYALGQATPPCAPPSMQGRLPPPSPPDPDDAIDVWRIRYDDMLPFVRSLRDAFGAERLMWATDCPYQLYQHYPACE